MFTFQALENMQRQQYLWNQVFAFQTLNKDIEMLTRELIITYLSHPYTLQMHLVVADRFQELIVFDHK